MLKTQITYTCSSCGANKDQAIPVGAHPYSTDALPNKWAHVPAATGRADDKIFCGKKACEDAATAERTKYNEDQDALDDGAADRFEAYVAAKVAAGGVDPRWALAAEERTAAEVLVVHATKTGVLPPAENAKASRRQMHDLWTTLTQAERDAAKAALRLKKGKEEGKEFSRILAAWDARP